VTRASRPLPLLAAGLLLLLVGAAWTSASSGSYLPRLTMAAGALLLVLFVIRHAADIRFLLLQARTHAEPGPTTSLLLIAVVLALGALLAGSRWVALDLTRDRINSLSDATRTALGTLREPLRMDGFFVQPSPQWDFAAQLLGLYAASSSKVEVGIFDPDRDPARARRLGVTQPGVVVVSYREATAHVTELGEEPLTQGILRVLEGHPRMVGFIQGHGEPQPNEGGEGGMTAWVQALGEANLLARTVNLIEEGRIPPEVSALLLVHPRQPLYPAEIAILRDYLDAGGGLGIWCEPGDSTGLESQLSLHYVRLPAGTIRDEGSVTERLGLGVWAPALAVNPSHPIGAEVVGSFAAGPGVRPVEIVTPHAMELTIEPLLRTSPTAQLLPGVEQVEGTPLATGAQTVGVVLEWEAAAGEGWSAKPDSLGLPPVKPKARVVVIGDASLVTNRYLGVGANRPLAVNAVHWLTWQERFLNIGRRMRASSDLAIGPQGLGTLRLVVEFGLPALLIASGLAVWFRRRARS
jgi:ABC-type uncharacterized transport system involved in gliding motility auxiliary subunit